MPIARILDTHRSVLVDAVPFGLLVWSTGLAPNPLIQSIQSVQKHEKTQKSVLTPLVARLQDIADRLFLAF